MSTPILSRSFAMRIALAFAFAAVSMLPHRATAQCAEGYSGEPVLYFSGNTFQQTGSRFGLTDWRVRPGIDQPGFMIYGPYDPRFGVGLHRAAFVLQVDDNTTSPRPIIASLQIYTRKGNRILARRDINRRDFLATNTWQSFFLYFENPCGEELETAIYWHGNAQLVFGQVQVVKL